MSNRPRLYNGANKSVHYERVIGTTIYTLCSIGLLVGRLVRGNKKEFYGSWNYVYHEGIVTCKNCIAINAKENKNV